MLVILAPRIPGMTTHSSLWPPSLSLPLNPGSFLLLMTGPRESESAPPVLSKEVFSGALPLEGVSLVWLGGSGDGGLGLENLLVLVALTRLLRPTFAQVE